MYYIITSVTTDNRYYFADFTEKRVPDSWSFGLREALKTFAQDADINPDHYVFTDVIPGKALNKQKILLTVPTLDNFEANYPELFL